MKPDLILSVHPNFNGSVINILEKNNINIPFTTLIADLVNIYPLWADKRADMIISPTEEAKQKCLEFGIPEEKIAVFGFPVRSRFFRKDTENQTNPSSLQFLIMSGGEGVGNMKEIAETLLTHFDCKIKIVAGRNIELKAELEQSLNKFGDKVDIFGFITNIQDLMHTSDIAFTRGSPNVMYEAFASNLPIIITGALPGQEEDNPLFATHYNLGVICNNTNDIKNTIHELIANDYEKWHSIKESQHECIHSHTAKDITDFLVRCVVRQSVQEVNLSSLKDKRRRREKRREKSSKEGNKEGK